VGEQLCLATAAQRLASIFAVFAKGALTGEVLKQGLFDVPGVFAIGKEELLVRIPRSSGHPFHEHLTTDSTVIRPPIPRVSDH